MPSSPPTPTRRRMSSNTPVPPSFKSPSPQSIDHPPKPFFDNPTSTQYSLASPSTPRPNFPSDTTGYFESSNGLGDPIHLGSADSLGNLADELADALDDDDEDSDHDHGLQHGASEELYERAEAIRHDRVKVNVYPVPRNLGNGHAISVSPARQGISDLSLSPPKQPSRSRHTRKSSQYDGSDYGDDSDLEVTHSPILEARLAAVESFARQGIQANGSDADTILRRMAESLRDLGTQTGVENGASRLITAHTALTTHISHQTRTLINLTHPLFSPLSTTPDLETIDELLPLLTSLVHTLPAATSQTLSALHNIHASTSDLVCVLTYLSDTLHVMRQTTTLASRRLRAARDLVVEMRRDAEARAEGVHWVEKGNWECRLAGRECAGVCGEVVDGFEEVCASWRERLASGMGGVEVGAA